MSAVDSTFFTLNEIATLIWQSADGKTPLSDIIDHRICQYFDVSREQAAKDAEQFISELSQHGILLISDRPIDTSNAAAGAK